MPNSLENQFIADTFKTLLHTGNISLSGGYPEAKIYSGDGFESSLTVSTATNGIKISGNTTVYGNISASGNSSVGSLSSGSHTVTGDSNISGNINIIGNSSVEGTLNSGSHTVTGNSNISGILSSGSHTVIGNSNISGTVSVVGSLSSGSHTVTGNSNISGTIKIESAATVVGSLSSGSHTVTGDSKITNRVDTDIIYANTYLNLPQTDTKADIVNHIYPVGSIFLSFNNIDPSFRFTGTQWTQVAKGRFIVGEGVGNDDNSENKLFTTGNNSGEYQHQLTEPEMPLHKHTGYGVSVASNGTPEGVFTNPYIVGKGVLYHQNPGHTGTAATASTQVSLDNELRIDSTGSSAYHNNTPPGFGMYIWQRTL